MTGPEPPAGTATPAGTVRIVVADDQAAVREGLATMLDLLADVDVVATAGTGEDALRLVAEHRPQVVLMDLHMPGCGGVEATRRIRADCPGTQVVVLTTYDDDGSVLGALRAGALGYLTKDAGRMEIARALHAAAAGQSVLAGPVRARLLEVVARQPVAPARGPAGPVWPDGLTRREAAVLTLIAAGLSNREIAAALFITQATVKTHVNNLFAKAHLRDRAQAVRYAYQHGLAPEPGSGEPPDAR